MTGKLQDAVKALISFNTLVGGSFAVGTAVLTASPYWETWVWKVALAVWLGLLLVLIGVAVRRAMRCTRQLEPSCKERLDAYARGCAALRANDPRAAEEHFEEASRDTPGYVLARFQRAKALRAIGEIEQATALLDQALQVDPDFANARALRRELLDLAGKATRAEHHRWRWLTRACGRGVVSALIIWVALSAGFSLWMLRAQIIQRKQFVIVVADIVEPTNSGYCTTEEILAQLREAMADEQDTRIVALGKVVPEQGGPDLARAIGRFHSADLVLWGWVATTSEAARSWVHMESLSELGELDLPLPSGRAYTMDISSVRSFSFQMDLAGHMGGLASAISAAARYEAQDYEGAILRAQGILSPQSDAASEEQQRAGLVLGISTLAVAAQSSDGVMLQESVRVLTNVIDSGADTYLARLNRGWARFLTEDYRDAWADFQYAIMLRPLDPRAYAGAAVSALWVEDESLATPQRALELINTAHELDKTNATYLQNRGIIYDQLGEVASAAEDFEAASAIQPENPRFLYDLGCVRVEIAKQTTDAVAAMEAKEAAVSALTQAIELCEGELDTLYAACHVELARLLEFSGELEEALEAHTTAINALPNESTGYERRAELRVKLLDFEGAIEDLTEAVRLGAPGELRDWRKQRIINIKLLACEAAEHAGDSHLEQGACAEAIEAYTRALRFAEDDTVRARLLEKRASARRAAGDEPGAATDEEEAARLRGSWRRMVLFGAAFVGAAVLLLGRLIR